MPGGKYEFQSRGGTHTMKISKIEMNEADRYEIDVAGLRGSCKVCFYCLIKFMIRKRM